MSSMEFKQSERLHLPSKHSHSSDSLGYISWLEEKHNHQISIQQSQQNDIYNSATAKKSNSNYALLTSYPQITSQERQFKDDQQQIEVISKKEILRNDQKKVVWDDKNSRAIAMAMKHLRQKVQQMKQKLAISQDVNRKLRTQNEDQQRILKQRTFQIQKLKHQLVLKDQSENNPQKYIQKSSNQLQLKQKIKDYQYQLQHKNTIILQLTTLIQQDKTTLSKDQQPDLMLYLQKINLLQSQLQLLRQKLKTQTNQSFNSQSQKLKIKYEKLLERLSNEQSRCSGYLKQAKQYQKIIGIYKDITKQLNTKINKLSENIKAPLKLTLSKLDNVGKSKSKQVKILNTNKSQRCLNRSKVKQSSLLLSLSRNNTHQRLNSKSIDQRKSHSQTSRKQKKMNCTQIPKIKQSKNQTFAKQRKKVLKQQISQIQIKISQIKREYKMLAGKIHENDQTNYQQIRGRLNMLALLLQQKTQQLFQKKQILNNI